MEFYKVEKFWLNCLPINKSVIEKITKEVCYIGFGLTGEIAIYQEEEEGLNCIDRFNPDPMLKNIFVFLAHIEKHIF